MMLVAIGSAGCSFRSGCITNYDAPESSNEAVDIEMQACVASEEFDLPYTFFSEKELVNAISSKSQASTVSAITEYYRPKKPTRGTSLSYILVKDFYIALRYDHISPTKEKQPRETYYLIEWYRTMGGVDIAEEIFRIYSPDVVAVKGQYYVIEAGPVQDVFWEEHGNIFHAVTPSGISEQELTSFCTVERVLIG